MKKNLLLLAALLLFAPAPARAQGLTLTLQIDLTPPQLEALDALLAAENAARAKLSAGGRLLAGPPRAALTREEFMQMHLAVTLGEFARRAEAAERSALLAAFTNAPAAQRAATIAALRNAAAKGAAPLKP